MAQIIGLPKLSPTMEEGVLVKWSKKEGDKVNPGDLIAEVETDKANMDFNIEDSGVLLKFLVKEGDTVKLGAPVMIMGKAGEDITALLAQAARETATGTTAAPAPVASPAPAVVAAAAPAAAPAPAVVAAPVVAAPVVAAPVVAAPVVAAPRGQVLASPLAKSLAIELGIDLRNLTGTGPGGRIVERDVRAATDAIPQAPMAAMASGPVSNTLPHAAPPAPMPPGASTALAVRAPAAAAAMHTDSVGDYTDIPASNMRKRIAVRLTEAKRDIPHFYLQRSIDAAPLLAFRQKLNDLLGDRGKVSVNDLVVKAVALALRRVPECNASWEGDLIRRHHRVHVGIAVAIEDGLVTPVVRDADLKGIGAIAAEIRDLAERAKSRGLKAHEITGSTFTISNLGMFGIERFTAILNPPEAGILAVGAVLDAAVVKDGAVVAGKRMTVSMSCDHRVIDGALGSKWLIAFADLLEHPESLAL
ncbi:MAG: pyruvate dehydrogenase complex dihydrolipoamide acetyltransferase [Kofleriaceae bacterium]|nr:pyruvate dehydrogenase complex dihydrolipoamide acetyltransferase [Kofleriaceae bacterium]